MKRSLLWTSLLCLSPFLAAAKADTIYPDDPFSCPLQDSWSCIQTLSGVSVSEETRYTRLANYVENEIRLLQNERGRHLLWRFEKKKEGQADSLTTLRFQRMLRTPPESIAIRVENASEKPVHLQLWIEEIPWHPKAKDAFRSWSIPAERALPSGSEERLVFPVRNAKPNGKCERQAPWMPARLQLEVKDVKHGTRYALHLSELTLNRSWDPVLQLSYLGVSPEIVAGEETVFSLEIKGELTDLPLDLEVRDENWVLWRIRLNDKERADLIHTGECIIRRTVPSWLPDRHLVVGLAAGGRRVSGETAKLQLRNASNPELPRMGRQVYRGRPTVFREDDPLTWCGYATYELQPGNMREFGASGADLFVIATNAGRHIHEITEPTWRGPGLFEFGELDQHASLALQSNPEANLLLRVSLGLPAFWLMDHEEEWALVQTDRGEIPWEESGLPVTSFASTVWRQQQTDNLRILIDHVKTQPWADRVIGFVLTCGVTEEWFWWGSNNGYFADYSVPAREAYSIWCREKGYPFTSPPQHVDRQHIGYDLFPASSEGKNAAAYAQFQSNLVAKTIEHFARVVKEETDGRSLVGVFHGYVLQLAGEARQHLAGHFALQRTLSCPDLDLFLGIPLHNYRQLGTGYDTYPTTIESIQRAGKVYVNENDLFSWLHQEPWTTEYSVQLPREATILMHQRVLANNAVHGVPGQWFSLFSHWHHDALLQEAFGQMIRINADVIRYDRTGTEQIAFVVDDTSFAWTPPLSALPKETHIKLLYVFAKTGAPVSTWLLSDLDQLPDRIRLVVVARASAAKPDDVAKLRRLIREGKRSLLLIGPAGLIDPNTQEWYTDAPADLTGLPIVVDYAEGSGTAQLAKSGVTVCELDTLQPRSRVSSPGFMVYSDEKVAGLERRLDHGGHLIWAGAPPCNEALAREWVKALGIHCYAPKLFSVHASRDLVAITAPTFGEHPLSWPHPVQAEDLFDGWKGSGKDFSCPFQGGQTRLFYVKPLGPEAEAAK